ncbi:MULTISPECIES: hypothetical protein [Desulfovibrio]|uniref:hypothetical protein n=1 Tax=Desulfovibrio TaxID=872 RepID=UPI0026F0B184|nr:MULTISPECIES: hypothetical protein [Desulfovibrio]MCI7617575.1 hypothetical protein [Desulfovibrio piger]MDY4808172.1 hypothetical protein [Desulfovibrio sp.]
MLINTETLEQVTEYNFRTARPNVSFPSVLTDAVLAPFGHAVLNPTPQPEIDSWTQGLSEGQPEQRDGKWYQTWVLTPVTHTPEEEAERLKSLKARKLDEINAAYQQAIATLTPTYPDDERLTFDKQEQEARAWLADNSTPTPFVDALAVGRQMDKAELVKRIIAKADAFAVASGSLTGQRQRYEDMLDVAETADAVAAIVPQYSLPGMEAQA